MKLIALLFLASASRAAEPAFDVSAALREARTDAVATPASSAVPEDLSDYDAIPFHRYVDRHARPLDWAEVFAGPERIIYIGETHTDLPLKPALADALAAAVRAGIAAFAMESLADNHEDLLADFRTDAGLLGDVEAAMKADFDFFDASYTPLAARAQALGLSLIGIDMPDPEYQVTRRFRTDEDGDELRGKARRLCRLHDVRCKARDCRMADNLAKALKTAPRVAVLVGSNHIVVDCQPRHMLKLHGVASRSYLVLYRDTDGPAFEAGVRESRWAETAALIPLPKKQARYDAIIWLPKPARR